MSVGVVVCEGAGVRGAGVGGAGVDREGEGVVEGGGEGVRDRPQAAIDTANTRIANKVLAACECGKRLSISLDQTSTNLTRSLESRKHNMPTGCSLSMLAAERT